VVTLVIKSVAEWQQEREMKAAAAMPPERPAAPLAPALAAEGTGRKTP
jgi:sulfate/thiosulfate transport system permease protein